jgi:hypothetical protein
MRCKRPKQGADDRRRKSCGRALHRSRRIDEFIAHRPCHHNDEGCAKRVLEA